MDENQMPPESKINPEKGSLGPVIGIIIVVGVLVIGGLYFYGAELNEQDNEPMTAAEIAASADPALEALEMQGTSDTVESIEDDLDATDLDELDDELRELEEEFNI